MKEVNGSIWHTMSTQRVTPTDFQGQQEQV